LTPAEIARARILSADEADRLYKNFDLDGDGVLDFGEFRAMVQPSLSKKYVSGKTKQRLADEERRKRDAEGVAGDVAKEMRGLFHGGHSHKGSDGGTPRRSPARGSAHRKAMVSP
jgi:hypothetical protein